MHRSADQAVLEYGVGALQVQSHFCAASQAVHAALLLGRLDDACVKDRLLTDRRARSLPVLCIFLVVK